MANASNNTIEAFNQKTVDEIYQVRVNALNADTAIKIYNWGIGGPTLNVKI